MTHTCSTQHLRQAVAALTLAAVFAGTAAAEEARVVSIGGAVTEILYALGKDKEIVGIDTTSLYPMSALKEKPSVGYMRQLSAEGVLGLNPSLILAIEGSGPKETLGVLQSAKVPMVIIPDSFSGEGIIEKTHAIAHAVGADARGRCVIDQVRADLTELQKVETGITKPKRVLFVLSFVNGRAMASGTKTAADGMIKLAGATNAITEYEGYRALSDEAIVAARPDVVMTIERGGQSPLTADAVFSHAAFQATPAAVQRAFISMDGLYLLGFGPRSARAARDVAIALYPDLKANALPSEGPGSHASCAK